MPSFTDAYALCLRMDNVPIGYLHAGLGEAHDLGNGLLEENWHRGLMTEAERVLIDRLRADGLPFVTAAHDVNTPPPAAASWRVWGWPVAAGRDAHPAHFIENAHP